MKVEKAATRIGPAATSRWAAFALATSLAIACGGDGPASPSEVGEANLTVMLTDAPIDEVDEVNIYFTSVTAKPAGAPVEELTLALPANPIDLLDLTDRTVSFATGAVEPGRFEFMHVNIDQERSFIVEDGVQKPLQVPSEEIKVLGGFTVDEDRRTTVTLDFDAARSLIKRGNGEWLLRPVIVMADDRLE